MPYHIELKGGLLGALHVVVTPQDKGTYSSAVTIVTENEAVIINTQ